MADGVTSAACTESGGDESRRPEFGSEFRNHAGALAGTAERVLASGAASQIAGEDIERVLTAAIKLYAAKAEAEAMPPPPLSADRITPTEVVVVISEMMRAVNLNLFDLSMWYRRAR
jgi:hypothetical protein